jgi:hypothetical protein
VKRRNRYLALALGAAMVVGSQAVSAVGQEFPPHPHVLLHGAEVVPVPDPPPFTPPYRIVGFDRCVELAAGQAIPLIAHHENLHFGRAGQAVRRGGLFVAPLDPLFPGITSCADLEAALPYPPPPS